MDFAKFTLLSIKENEPIREREEEILFNLSHIVSIKPINIVMGEKVIQGYWVRLTNGKKYRVVKIPLYLEDIINSSESRNYYVEAENLELFTEKQQ